MNINSLKPFSNLIFSCPKCYRIPIIHIVKGDFTIKCLCNYENKISVNENQNFLNEIYFQSKISKIFLKEKCGCCGELISENKDKYVCFMCSSLFCKKCYENHEHKKINQYNINTICPIHYKQFFAFCKTCNQNICPIFTSHINHNIILFENLHIKEEEIDFYLKDQKEKITEGIQKLNEIYGRIIKIVDDLYSKFKKELDNELKLKEIVVSDYKKGNKFNYFSILNVNNMVRERSLDIIKDKEEVVFEFYDMILEKLKKECEGNRNGNNIYNNIGYYNSNHNNNTTHNNDTPVGNNSTSNVVENTKTNYISLKIINDFYFNVRKINCISDLYEGFIYFFCFSSLTSSSFIS